jgi:hypothetical protein
MILNTPKAEVRGSNPFGRASNKRLCGLLFRRAGLPHISKSFRVLKHAQAWARQMEVKADRNELPADPAALRGITLGDLVRRYRDTVSVEKRGNAIEQYVLNAFLGQPLCSKQVSALRTEDFAAYRDQRLREIKPASLKR